MIRTRWHKVLIDLWRNRARTLVVALAIAVGVYAVGGVINTRELLLREFEADHEGAREADAIIQTMPFNSSFAERIAEIPGVAVAEGRHQARGRLYRSADEWQDVALVSVPDFEQAGVDLVMPLAGRFPPGDREVVIEHLALQYLNLDIGDRLMLEMENGVEKSLTIVGTVHDPQRLSPELFGDPTGFVTPETMEAMGAGRQFSELRLRVEGDAGDKTYVRSVVSRVEEQLEDSGRPVISTTLPEQIIRPIIDTLIMIISTFGVTILLLSGFLVVNAISALITQQIQQIGVMKLIGARRNQIMSLYLVTVLIYGLMAVTLGIPASVYSARYFMDWRIAFMLNIVPDSYAIPLPLITLQAAVGLLLPLLAGLIPVWKGTRITTFQALNNVGVKGEAQGHGLVEPLLLRLQSAGIFRRPVVLAVRNTLRHKGRLAQTLFVLIFGTALFIAVLTVRTSVNETIDGFLRFHQYDVSVGLRQPQRLPRMEQIARSVPGVVDVESWSLGAGTRVRPDDSESEFMRVYAVPPQTMAMDPRADSGRWLQSGDEYAVVVNSDVMEDEPDLQVGEEMVLDIGGRQLAWEIVGVVPTTAQGPVVYLPYETYAYVTRTPGRATHVQVIAIQHDAVFQRSLESELFAAFEAAGQEVDSTRTSQFIKAQNEQMFNLVVIFLIIMAVLLAAVGGLGLTTTMSINILERIREIGVLRAIGASNGAVRKIVLLEGVVIGILSWTLGLLVSFPVGVLMSNQVGLALLGIPLTYRYAVSAAVAWFFVLLLIAVAASLGPARNAVRLTVREVLAYE